MGAAFSRSFSSNAFMAKEGGATGSFSRAFDPLAFDVVPITIVDYSPDLLQLPRPRGYNPYHFVELLGGTVVQTLGYEPDAVTFRNEYYYNARLQTLFARKWVARRPREGVMVAKWHPISNA